MRTVFITFHLSNQNPHKCCHLLIKMLLNWILIGPQEHDIMKF